MFRFPAPDFFTPRENGGFFYFRNHIFFALLPFFVFSCGEAAGKLKLVEGNFYFSRGMVNEAIGAYLSAEKFPETAAYANFALGSTYLSLEQTEAALERFEKAENALPAAGERRSLLFSVRYNRAVAYFECDDFEHAAEGFRKALEVDNSSREAKRNLELSLISMERQFQNTAIEHISTGSAGYGKNERNDMLFDYIRQQESGKWKSWEWSGEEEDTGPDY